MGTIIKVGLAVFCFLLAPRCLFVKADDDDPPPRSPDALDKAAYELIFRRGAPAPVGKGSSSQGARVIGFVLFTGLGIALLVSAFG